MSNRACLPVPGWFGKIPALGDFATRGLPVEFTDPWDTWLSSQLHAAQFDLEKTWNSVYDQAAAVCFALSTGVIDTQAWYGLLMPSRDRVGRRFPLTIACSWPADAIYSPGLPWWSAVFTAAEQAVRAGGGAESLDLALRAITTGSPAATSPASTSPAAALKFRQHTPASLGLGGGGSRWWRYVTAEDSENLAAHCAGLPVGGAFRRLLETR